MVGDSGRPFEMRAKSLTGAQLRAWRLARGWSPVDFRRWTGIAPERLEALETGKEPMLRRMEMMVEQMSDPMPRDD